MVPPRTPLVVLLAGPNGAGKSTSAAHLLRGALSVEEFVNADTIAQGLSAYRPAAAAGAAGRVMLESGSASWRANAETSPSRRRLPAAELAVARVAERVRQGGHHVPDDVVRRRFAAGLRNLFTLYHDVADSWQVYDNAELAGPRLIASRAAGMLPVIADPGAWDGLKEPQ